MIRISTLSIDKSHPEDAAEYATAKEHTFLTPIESMTVFTDQDVVSAVVRCDDDMEFLGMLRVAGLASNTIAKAALEDVEPGTVVEAKGWQSRGQLIDAAGWRLVFGFEMTKLRKPKEAVEEKRS